jgi:hypothetical protein
VANDAGLEGEGYLRKYHKIMGSKIMSSKKFDLDEYKKSIKEVYGGKILFGYYKRNKKLVKNNNELETLKLIIKLRDEDKLSYKKISDYLNSENIKSKEGGKWYGYSVSCVLNNGMKEKYLI